MGIRFRRGVEAFERVILSHHEPAEDLWLCLATEHPVCGPGQLLPGGWTKNSIAYFLYVVLAFHTPALVLHLTHVIPHRLRMTSSHSFSSCCPGLGRCLSRCNAPGTLLIFATSFATEAAALVEHIRSHMRHGDSTRAAKTEVGVCGVVEAQRLTRHFAGFYGFRSGYYHLHRLPARGDFLHHGSGGPQVVSEPTKANVTCLDRFLYYIMCIYIYVYLYIYIYIYISTWSLSLVHVR